MTIRVLLFALLCCLAITAVRGYEEAEMDEHFLDFMRLVDPGLVPTLARQSRDLACIQTSCRKSGESCVETQNSTDCAYGLVCHKSKCEHPNAGARCKNNDDCFGWDAVCVAGKCSYFSYPGDGCTSNEECANGLPCVDNFCQGKGNGASCNPNVTQCAVGYYCDRGSKTCTASLPAGSACSSSTRCAFPSFCVQGVCTLLFSQPAASSCRDYFIASVCNPGLYCLNRTCQSPPAQPFPIQSCDNATCPSGKCQCMPFVGQAFCATPFYAPSGSDCNFAMQGAAQCLAYNKCSLSGIPKETSCAIVNCGGYLLQGINCLCPSIQKIAGDCYAIPVGKCANYHHNPDYDSDDDGQDDDDDKAGLALSLLLGFVTLIVLTVSFIVLFIKHRQSSYQTISL